MRTQLSLVAALLVVAGALSLSAWAQDNSSHSAAQKVTNAVDQYKAGNMSGALVLFGQALDDRNNFAPAIYGKAAIQFIMGKFTDASETLQNYVAGNQSDSYAWMWAYVAEARGNSADRATLVGMQAITDESSWLGMTLALFLQQVTPDDYVAQMKGQAGAATSKALLVRTYFMAGEAQFVAGNKDEAAKLLQSAADAPGNFQWEREMAKAELKRFRGVVEPIESTTGM